MPDSRIPGPVRWHRSVAAKSFAIAFVATHLPLLSLIALLELAPGWMSPLQVLGVALVSTLVATVVVITVLWRLFAPLRAAADGLHQFMLSGQLPGAAPASQDEIGRLMGVLVQALAHLDRSRTPLLQAASIALEGRSRRQLPDPTASQTMALIEVDQWKMLDTAASVDRMRLVQLALGQLLESLLEEGELVLPWGRGRFLAVLNGPVSSAMDRLDEIRRGFTDGAGRAYTCSAVLEPRSSHVSGWPAALQRMEYRLFALRLEGVGARLV